MNPQQVILVGLVFGARLSFQNVSWALVAPILATSLLLGSNEADAAQAVVSGEFVGAIPESDPTDPAGPAANELVAVVVNDPSPTGARAIRAYVCDGDVSRGNDGEWFKGIIRGDTFGLTSASGKASIQGQLTESAVTGTTTLADGRILNYRAVPAKLGAGLFEVFYLPNDLLSGVSASGATLTGRIANEEARDAITIRALTGTIKPLNGPTIPFRVGNRILNDTGTDLQATVIVLPNASQITGKGAEIKSGKLSNFAWGFLE